MQLCPAIVKMKKRKFSRGADYICWYKGVSRDDKSRDNWSGVYIYEIIIEKNIVMTSHSKERKNGGHLNEQVSNFKQKKKRGRDIYCYYIIIIMLPLSRVFAIHLKVMKRALKLRGLKNFKKGLSVINRANICFRRISVCQLKSE